MSAPLVGSDAANDAVPATSTAGSVPQGTRDASASHTAAGAVQPVAAVAAGATAAVPPVERYAGQPVEAVLASLPAVWKGDTGEVEGREGADETVTVVLDDDPTGTQTVHDVAVLTTW